MFGSKGFGAVVVGLGLIGAGVGAMPGTAKAWWAGGWGWHGGIRFGVALPPVVVGPPIYTPPPLVYARPPPYYPRPRAYWIPSHWQGGYWVPGHWG